MSADHRAFSGVESAFQDDLAYSNEIGKYILRCGVGWGGGGQLGMHTSPSDPEMCRESHSAEGAAVTLGGR